MEIANSGANLVSDRKVDISRNLGCALADFYGHYSSRDLHVRQVKTTSPHSEYFHALDSSLFQSNRQFLGYVHPDPLCEFAVRSPLSQSDREYEAVKLRGDTQNCRN